MIFNGHDSCTCLRTRTIALVMFEWSRMEGDASANFSGKMKLEERRKKEQKKEKQKEKRKNRASLVKSERLR